MKENFTSEELAKLKALSQKLEFITNKIQPLQQAFQQYSQKQSELTQELKEKYNLPETDLSKWDFSQVDWLEFEGEVIVPEEDDSDGDR